MQTMLTKTGKSIQVMKNAMNKAGIVLALRAHFAFKVECPTEKSKVIDRSDSNGWFISETNISYMKFLFIEELRDEQLSRGSTPVGRELGEFGLQKIYNLRPKLSC